MEKKRIPTLNLSVPDETVREFAQQQATAFFANNLSAYIVSLIKGDRDEGWTHQRILKAVQDALAEDQPERAA